jgi:hypothetical protein
VRLFLCGLSFTPRGSRGNVFAVCAACSHGHGNPRFYEVELNDVNRDWKMIAGERTKEENSRKTLDEHKGYIEQLCRISFFYARYLKERYPEESIGMLLRKRTPFFHHALNMGGHIEKGNEPDCLRIEALADKIGNLAIEEFEERMYSEIKKLAMARAEEFYPVSVGMGVPPDWNVRSLKYDPPGEKLPSSWCNFHIANWTAPKSFFDDPRHLPECFLELMDKSAREYGYDTLHTSTWLNDNPRWLALFPKEWKTNLSRRSGLPGWSFGNWGQLVTARGTFNYRAGQHVRTHMELKYKCARSHCSFEAMRRHLESFLKE